MPCSSRECAAAQAALSRVVGPVALWSCRQNEPYDCIDCAGLV